LPGGPYSTYTDSTEVVANYFYTQLLANKASFTDGLVTPTAVQAVWYGDQSGLIPQLPALCIVPGPETSAYNGVGGRPVIMNFQTFVMVYYGKMMQDQQKNVHASLTIANQIKRFMNLDITLGGNAIDCMCAGIDPGIAIRGGAMIDTTRMIFRTRSKVALNS
jgi:hypothetical protein